MIGVLLRAAPRRARRAPVLATLTVAAVALGSGAVLSVQLLNRGALGVLDASLEAVSDGTDLRIAGVVEEPGSTPDEAWPRVLGIAGVEAASPLVHLPGVDVESDAGAVSRIALYGVDLFSSPYDFSQDGGAGSGGPSSTAGSAFLPDLFFAGGVVLPDGVAARLGVAPGDIVRLSAGNGERAVPVAGTYPFEGGGRETAFADLAHAQALRGDGGGLDRIEVRLAPGEDAGEVAARIENSVAGIRAATPEGLRAEGADLFAAFRLNLTALSVVSLLVGAFLVYASVRASLAARRQEIGLYRALGAPAGRVGVALLAETALLGLVGAALGAPIGALAADFALDRVSATITNFYLLDRIRDLPLDPSAVALSLLSGVVGALLGALPEVVSEARRPPVALLAPGREGPPRRPGGRPRLRLSAAIGALLVAGSLLPFAFPEAASSRPEIGFAAAGALLFGAALLPSAFFFAAAKLARPFEAGASPNLRRFGALDGLLAAAREPGTAAPPAAALVAAVTMLVGVTVLVSSFRATVDVWLQETLVADIYVARFGGSARAGTGNRRSLDPATLGRLAREPGVAHRDFLRIARVRFDGLPITVLGTEVSGPRSAERFAFLGDADAAWRGFEDGGALVSEPLSHRSGLGAGDRFLLPTAAGEEPLRVAGVYRDYGNQLGAVVLPLAEMNRLFPPSGGGPSVHGVALTLAPGVEAEAVAARLAGDLDPGVQVRENGFLRAQALRVFDQTFAVTAQLRTFALLIAALGLALSLWTLARERLPEAALLRALGARRRQVAALCVGRALLVGVAGVVVGGGAGAVLALLLTEVVNPAWFGWTLEVRWPLSAIPGQAALVLLAAVLAAVLPARRFARAGATELRREL